MIRRAADDDSWDVSTRDPLVKKQLERQGWTVREDAQGLWHARLPRKMVRFRSTVSAKRAVSPKSLDALQRKRTKLPDPVAGVDSLKTEITPRSESMENAGEPFPDPAVKE